MDFHTNILKQQDTNIVIVSGYSCADQLAILKECCQVGQVGLTAPTKMLNLRRPFPMAFTPGHQLPALIIADSYYWKCEFRFVLPEFKDISRMHGALSFLSHMFRQQHAGSFISVLLNKDLAYGVSGCRSYGGFGQNFFDVEFLIDKDYRETLESSKSEAAGSSDQQSQGRPTDPNVFGVVWLRLLRRIGKALFTYLRLLSSEFANNPNTFSTWRDFQVIKTFQWNSTSGPDALTLANEIGTKLSSIYRKPVENESRLPDLLIDPPPPSDAADMSAAIRDLVENVLTPNKCICILAGENMSGRQFPDWLGHRGSSLLDRKALEAEASLHGISPDQPTIVWETDPWFGMKYTLCDLPTRISDYFFSNTTAPTLGRGQEYSLELVGGLQNASSSTAVKASVQPRREKSSRSDR